MSDTLDLNIRKAVVDDVDTIVDFNQRLANETEDRQLPDRVLSAGVRKALELPGDVRYFVAEHDGEIVGQLMITREWSDWRNGWAAWLQSVYVRSDYRGRGVFRRLLGFVHQILSDDSDTVLLRLYVENENLVAQETYRKLGFQDPGYQVMEMPISPS